MANKIKRIPLRTKWFYLQHFQRSGHDCQRVSRAARAGGSAMPGTAIASTPNQVLNRSCMVAIPMQNKKKMLNNER